MLLRLLTGKLGDNPVCHNTFILLQVFFLAEIQTFFSPLTNRSHLGLFCSAAHVWKPTSSSVFPRRGTYCTSDLIKSISSWHTSSCNAYSIKRRRRRKHPASAATSQETSGGRKIGAQNLILKLKPSLPPWPGIMWLVVRRTHQILFRETKSRTIIAAGDLKQPECWLRLCLASLRESLCKHSRSWKSALWWSRQAYPHKTNIAFTTVVLVTPSVRILALPGLCRGESGKATILPGGSKTLAFGCKQRANPCANSGYWCAACGAFRGERLKFNVQQFWNNARKPPASIPPPSICLIMSF